MGAHNITVYEASQVTMTVNNQSHIFIHEEYDAFNIVNDVAVVKLPSPVTLNGTYFNC